MTVLTPDRDMFVEQLSVENPQLKAFRFRPAPNQLPPGVNAARFTVCRHLRQLRFSSSRTMQEPWP